MTIPQRALARIESKTHLGPDAQVDDRYLVMGPARPELTDPFLVLSEDWFSSPGFEWHPHRGVETVTLVVDGVLEHGDSAGNSGALTTGDVQWMTAGHGIIHRELAFRDERAHTLQLWVNLPADRKLTGPRYQDLLAGQRPVIEQDGTRIDVISGQVGELSGPAVNEWPISGAILTLEPGHRLDHLLPGRDRAFLYVLSGRASIAGHAVEAGQIAWSDPAPPALVSSIAVEARGDTPVVVMAYSGEPIGEPVAVGGPFVMNTEDEIAQAFRDFHRGDFGDVPRQARLQYR
ncbi:pirin family protein [Amycolatopsis sp. NPDC005961]|uniref:pirin family protein n=1 Tax=Amycolatopsis sp. NPDC005961 TaxID=3156720 RepID=UPI0033F56539